jgi:hypothetical protein
LCQANDCRGWIVDPDEIHLLAHKRRGKKTFANANGCRATAK